MRIFSGINRYSIVIILLLGQLTFYTIVYQLPHVDEEAKPQSCNLQLLSNSKKNFNSRGKDWFTINEQRGVVECNHTEVRAFMEAYPEYSKKPPSVPYHKENFRAAKKVLDKLKVPFFLSHGTLLGWRRECDFILHTHDVDLGAPQEIALRKKREIIQAMEAEGFKYIHEAKKEYDDELKFFRNGPLDIFLYQSDTAVIGEETEVITSKLYFGNDIARTQFFPFTDFVYVRLAGELVLAPSRADDWLAFSYGPEWNIPQSNYDFWNSPTNTLTEEYIHQNVPFDVELEKYGPNIAINPSFEEIVNEDGKDILVGWENFPIGNKAKSGKHSTLFDKKEDMEEIISHQFIYPENPSREYLLSGWAFVESATERGIFDNRKVAIWINFFQNETYTNGWWDNWLLFDITKLGQWQYISTEIKSPFDPYSIQIVVRNAVNAKVYFDDISCRPKSSCSLHCSHGNCIYGTCICHTNYKGPFCDIKIQV